MPVRKSYRSPRGYGKRKSSRKTYTGRQTKRRARTRAVTKKSNRNFNRTGWSSIPLQIANKQSYKNKYALTFTDTVVVYPEDDTTGDYGAFSKAISASQPNWVWYAADQAAGGRGLGNISHLDPAGTSGKNGQCMNVFADFDEFFVMSARIDIQAMPIIANIENLDPTWKFNNESTIWLTLDKDPQPHCSGSTMAGLTEPQEIKKARNTILGQTLAVKNGVRKGCSLSGVYTPNRTYMVRDILDRTAFWGLTQGDYGNITTAPSSQSFWNFGAFSRSPVPTGAAGGAFVRGVPLPHKFDIKVTYYCQFFKPQSVHANVPIGPNMDS